MANILDKYIVFDITLCKGFISVFDAIPRVILLYQMANILNKSSIFDITSC